MTDSMPVLTLWQPWASLIAIGAKTIETRSWSTKHRGRIAIHAAARLIRPGDIGDYAVGARSDGSWAELVERTDGGLGTRYPLPRGVIVATAELVDVVPMVGADEAQDGPFLYVDEGNFIQLHDGPEDGVPIYNESELAYGVFRPGRFAWLLADVQPLAEPVPFKGGQGLTRRWTP